MVFQPAMLGAGDDRSAFRIEFANQVQVKLKTGDFKLARRRAVADVEGMQPRCLAEAEALHPDNGSPEQRSEVRVVPLPSIGRCAE